MEAFYDPSRVYAAVRLHPYSATGADQAGFIDFKTSPEKITTALEDFRPFANREAVQVFYDLLRDINGPDSHLETSDSAFRQPVPNRDLHSRHALCAYGRLYILFRDLRLNCSSSHTDWLTSKLLAVLTEADPTMTATDGVVAMTLTKILHTGLSKGVWLDGLGFDCADDDPGFGKHLMLSFFAYGDDEDQVYINLARIFKNIREACDRISQEIAVSLQTTAGKT